MYEEKYCLLPEQRQIKKKSKSI